MTAPSQLPWLPDQQDVADLITRFVPRADGDLSHGFTDETSPTSEAVDRILIAAAGDVAAEVGDDLAERLWPAARRVAAMHAAVDILISYGPELVGTDATDIVDRLQKRFDDSLARLRAAQERAESGGDDTSPGGDSGAGGGFVGTVSAHFDGPRVPIGWSGPGW